MLWNRRVSDSARHAGISSGWLRLRRFRQLPQLRRKSRGVSKSSPRSSGFVVRAIPFRHCITPPPETVTQRFNIDCHVNLQWKARLVIEDGRTICKPVEESVFDFTDCVCGCGATHHMKVQDSCISTTSCRNTTRAESVAVAQFALQCLQTVSQFLRLFKPVHEERQNGRHIRQPDKRSSENAA